MTFPISGPSLHLPRDHFGGNPSLSAHARRLGGRQREMGESESGSGSRMLQGSRMDLKAVVWPVCSPVLQRSFLLRALSILTRGGERDGGALDLVCRKNFCVFSPVFGLLLAPDIRTDVCKLSASCQCPFSYLYFS